MASGEVTMGVQANDSSSARADPRAASCRRHPDHLACDLAVGR